MPSAGKKVDRKIILTVGIILLLLLLISGYRTLRRNARLVFGDFFYPYLALSKVGNDKLSDQTLLLYNRYELARKVEELMRVNRHLSINSLTASELLTENNELRQLLQLKPAVGWRYTGAEIIMRDPLLWNEQFFINRGNDAQLRSGSAVMTVTPDGRPIFVGILAEVGKHTSKVITAFHPTLRISAKLSSSGTIGILNYGKSEPEFDSVPIGFLPAQGNYVLQEAVMTTGFERGIPPAVKMGELSKIEDRPSVFSNEMFISGTVKPAVQLNSIRFLLVAERLDDAKEATLEP